MLLLRRVLMVLVWLLLLLLLVLPHLHGRLLLLLLLLLLLQCNRSRPVLLCLHRRGLLIDIPGGGRERRRQPITSAHRGRATRCGLF